MSPCPGCGASSDLIEYESSVGLHLCGGCGRVCASGAAPHDDDGDGDGSGGLWREEAEFDGSTRLGQFVALQRGFHPAGDDEAQPPPAEPSLQTQIAHQRVHARAYELVSLLRLPQSLVAQSLRLLETTTRGRYGPSRWTTLILGACIYALCRLARRPLSLVDVGDAVQTSGFGLARVVSRVCDANHLMLHALDPSAFIERVIGRAADAITHAGVEETVVRRTANTLLKLAHREWLDAGRAPTGLCGAAMHLALRANGVDFPLASIGSVLHVGTSTVTARVRELKAAVIAIARVHLPWLFDADQTAGRHADSAARHMTFIMENIDVIMQVQEAEADEMYAAPLVTKEPITTSTPSSPPAAVVAATPPIAGVAHLTQTAVTAVPLDDSNFSDLDDAELQHYIRTPSELRQLERIQRATDHDKHGRKRPRSRLRDEANDEDGRVDDGQHDSPRSVPTMDKSPFHYGGF